MRSTPLCLAPVLPPAFFGKSHRPLSLLCKCILQGTPTRRRNKDSSLVLLQNLLELNIYRSFALRSNLLIPGREGVVRIGLPSGRLGALRAVDSPSLGRIVAIKDNLSVRTAMALVEKAIGVYYFASHGLSFN